MVEKRGRVAGQFGSQQFNLLFELPPKHCMNIVCVDFINNYVYVSD